MSPSSLPQSESFVAEIARNENEQPLERVARALFERDVKRSIGLAAMPYVWPRVAAEYREQAAVALSAIDLDTPTDEEAS